MILRRILLTLAVFGFIACAPVHSAIVEEPATITLARSTCFGFCPGYRVTISGNGDVVYVGQRFVNVVGERRTHISQEEVQRLLRRFDEIGFEDLHDVYRAPITDLPTYTLTLERNGRRKTVVDYGGVSAGMPRAVRELQDEVDRVANTSQWVLRNGQPVREQPQP